MLIHANREVTATNKQNTVKPCNYYTFDARIILTNIYDFQYLA